MADDNTLTLQELGGPNPLTVRFSAADHSMPAELPLIFEQRSKETYYPGWSEPSVQVLGSKRDVMQLEGRLDDRYMGRLIAGATMESLQAMVVNEQLVELRWAAVLLRGFLKKAKFTVMLESKIDYKLEFLPTGDEPVMVARLRRQTPSDLSSRLTDLSATLKAIVEAGENAAGVAQAAVDQVSAAVDQVRTTIAEVEGVLQDFGNVAEDAVSTVGRVVGVLSETRSFCAAMVNETEIIDAQAVAVRSDAASAFAAEDWRYALSYNSRLAISQSSELKEALDRSAPDSRIHIVRQGETLPNIARRHYGDARAWTTIADANDLDLASQPTAGQALIIPVDSGIRL